MCSWFSVEARKFPQGPLQLLSNASALMPCSIDCAKVKKEKGSPF